MPERNAVSLNAHGLSLASARLRDVMNAIEPRQTGVLACEMTFARALLGPISSEALDSYMDFELYPTITLREGSFNVLVAPRAGPEGCLGQMAEGV